MNDFNNDMFVNMHVPTHDILRVQAAPSAVFELMHVGLRLMPDVPDHKRSDWVKALMKRRPDLVAKLASLWKNGHSLGMELPYLASVYGYVRDTDVKRFLDILPELALRHHESIRSNAERAPDEALKDQMIRGVAECVRYLADPVLARNYAETWRDLWQEMLPLWQQEGLALTTKDAQVLNAALAGGKDILELIPQRHMAHLEQYSSVITKYNQESFILLSPMYFIGAGGHTLYTKDMLFLGYSVRNEQNIQQITERSQVLAQQVKALADPTRLTILSLISEFEHNITVGDLAKRFEVSQPTISGHLKILREAELVQVSREGNRAYYTTDTKRIIDLMSEVESLVMAARDSTDHSEKKQRQAALSSSVLS